jgi:hypothetical protein
MYRQSDFHNNYGSDLVSLPATSPSIAAMSARMYADGEQTQSGVSADDATVANRLWTGIENQCQHLPTVHVGVFHCQHSSTCVY